jgi:hypothetical protein
MRNQNALYEQAAAEFGAAVDRLARAYEADADKRRDLCQEIHMALGEVSEFTIRDARCERGFTGLRITLLRRTSFDSGVHGRTRC